MEGAVKKLQDLGLTYTQARVYLAVLSAGPCTFHRISKISKVSRSEVYRETIYLEQAGLVEKSFTRPTNVKAIPVKFALQNFVDFKKREHEKHISKLESTLNEFVRCNLPEVKCNIEKAKAPYKIDFSLISKRQAIIAKSISMLEEAEEEVCFRYSPRKLCAFLDFCDSAFSSALKRGVNIRLITTEPDFCGVTNTIRSMTESKNRILEVGFLSNISFGLTIIDKKQLMVETATEDLSEDLFSNKSMLWTNNPILLSILHKDFRQTWLNCLHTIELTPGSCKPAEAALIANS